MALAGALLALAVPARAQTTTPTPFLSIPQAEQSAYHFDFRKTFFKTDADYQNALRSLDAQVAHLQTLKGHVLQSPQTLYATLKQSDDLNVLFDKIDAYLSLKYSVNTKDTTSRDASSALEARINPQLAFVNDEVQKITPAQLQKDIKAYPLLLPYRYAITEAMRYRPHTLTLKEEQLLAATQPLVLKWQEDQYDLLLDRAPWGTVTDPAQGTLDVRQDVARIANSADRDVRQAGFDKTYAALQSERDLIAFDFIARANARNQIARLHHFKNGEEARFFDIHLTYADVETAYATILAHGTLRKRLQTMQRDRVAAFSGFPTVHSYDMTLVPPGVEKPRFTIDQATTTIEASTAYLGPEWNGQLRALLNPANGRLDLVPGPNRAPGAFTYTLPVMDSPFFSYGYEGYLDDVSTLAHESGHAVHQGLMNAARVPPANMYGPSYFTESYAILDEMVLHDKLYREETNPGRKVYYLEQLLQQLMSFYGNARIAAVEKAVYEGVDKGTVKSADDIDALTHKIGAQVSIWHDLEPAQTNDLWEEVPHFYRNSTPYENYVFADLLAETYFTLYKKNPADFARRFTALERNGFNDTPQALLKKFLGISLSDPKTYDAVFAQQQSYLNDLQTLYAQVPVTTMKAP